MNIAFTPVTRLGLLGSARIKAFAHSLTRMLKTPMMKIGKALSIGALAAVSAGACKQQLPTDKPVQYSAAHSVSHVATAIDAWRILAQAGLHDRAVADQLIIKVESIDSVGTNPAVRTDPVSAVMFKRRAGFQHQIVVAPLPASTNLRTAKPSVGSPVSVSM